MDENLLTNATLNLGNSPTWAKKTYPVHKNREFKL